MKAEAKSALVLTATLLIGVVLGMVGHATWQERRIQQVGALRQPVGFTAHIAEILQLTAEQQTALAPIMESTGIQNQSIIRDAQSALRVSLDSMATQLAPHLTAEQQNRLAGMSRMLPDPFRRPPPPGEMRGPGDGRGPPPLDGRGPPPLDGRGPPPTGEGRGDGRGPPPPPPQ